MILKFEKIEKELHPLKKKGKKIVLCHGGFDFLHYGHIDHLKKAKKLGDILVVSTTEDNFFEKGPGRPFYNNFKRSNFLNELKCVDYVVITPFKYAKEVIEKVKPNIYCKGTEYSEKNPINKKIFEDRLIVKKYGGVVKYLGDNIMSSSSLIKNLDGENKNLGQNLDFKQIVSIFKKIKKKKILVIGETIFDRYVYIDIKGLTSKNTIMSGNYHSEKVYYGGAYKIFSNILNFCPDTKFFTIFNDNNSKYSNFLKRNKKIVKFADKDFINIEKTKYVKSTSIDSKNIELEKFFGTSKINLDFNYKKSQKNKILNRLKKIIKEFDLIIVADYGHGLIDKDVSKLIQKNANLLSLNVQTNSMNYGMNIITDKYKKCDNFVIDLKEMRLAVRDKNINEENGLRLVKKKLNSKSGYLTVGSKFSLGLNSIKKSKILPLNKDIIDTIGAGDAYFSINSILQLSEIDLDKINFFSQVAGAFACGYDNNDYDLNYQSFLNYIKRYI